MTGASPGAARAPDAGPRANTRDFGMSAGEARIELLVARANRIAGDITRTISGRTAREGVGTSVGSLASVATMLTDLSADVLARREREAHHDAALRRIAELKVRDAVALMERHDWKQLCAELQAIAEEALRR